MRFFRRGAAIGLCAVAGVLLGAVAPASAQVLVPPSAEAADIAACLCLSQALSASGTAMTERQRSYEASRQEVADLDARLQNARTSVNVDNPNAVAQFRQLLDQRDAAYRRSSGTLFTQYQNAVALYNQRTSEYNARCADRPRNPLLLNQVQATLVCPAGP